MRRARREAARHAPCERRSVFYAVAQTLQARPGYSAESSPAIARCSSRPGRIRALRTTGPTALDPSSEPLPRSSFFPSLRLPLRKGRSSPLQSSLTTRGTTSTRWWRQQECCSRPLSTAGKLRGRVRSRRGSGGRRRSGLRARVPPGREGVGWCGRLPRGRGAQGTRRCCCCSAAAALASAAAARASRAGYINTRFHTPELTSAGPAQPRAGGRGAKARSGRATWAGAVGRRSRRPASANRVRRAQRGVLTRHRPGAYGGAALDAPAPSQAPSSPTPLASISAVSPVSPPTPPTSPHPAASSRAP